MLYAAKYTNQGGRTVNEDCCEIFCKNNIVCATVADGLGSYGGGEIASSIAVKSVGEYIQQESISEPVDLNTCMQAINEEVVKAQTNLCKMKTTLTVLVVNTEDKKCFWAHVGDSRIYHFINGKMDSVTVDHSVSRMAVFAGEITFEQIRHHGDRSKLLRALGNDDEANVELSDVCDLSVDNHAFLLCSDGFWEYVYEAEMEETLQNSENPVQWIDQMALILQSRVDGKNDNNTAVAIWIMNGDET